jgi:AbrB family looped-hinge helix DNA binding protein
MDKRLSKAPESKIGKNGRITIPKVIREHLRLQPKDRVDFFISPEGTLCCRRASPSPDEARQSTRYTSKAPGKVK